MPQKNQQKLKKLEKLLEVALDDAMTKTEVVEYFKIITDVIKKLSIDLKSKNDEDIKENKKRIDKFISDIEKDFSDKNNKLFKDQQKALNYLYDKVRGLKDGVDGLDGEDGKDGKDGKDADETKIIKEVLKQVKEETTESLKEKLKDVLDDIDKRFSNIPRGGGHTPHNLVQYYDLSSQLNGSDKSFYVPLHRKVVLLTGTQFPIVYRPGTDFTTSNHTLTLTSEVAAPESGQTLIFQFIK